MTEPAVVSPRRRCSSGPNTSSRGGNAAAAAGLGRSSSARMVLPTPHAQDLYASQYYHHPAHSYYYHHPPPSYYYDPYSFYGGYPPPPHPYGAYHHPAAASPYGMPPTPLRRGRTHPSLTTQNESDPTNEPLDQEQDGHFCIKKEEKGSESNAFTAASTATAARKLEMVSSSSGNFNAMYPKCVPLQGPIPSKFYGDIEANKDAPVPVFDEIVNFPQYLAKNATQQGDGTRSCVMCGKERLCTATWGGAGNAAGTGASAEADIIIPRQNKGLCTKCDVAIWELVHHKDHTQIKWCKGCKNFRPWAGFGEKGSATKCTKCRDRQKEKYALQKGSSVPSLSKRRRSSVCSAMSISPPPSKRSSLVIPNTTSSASKEDQSLVKDVIQRLQEEARGGLITSSQGNEAQDSLASLSSSASSSPEPQSESTNTITTANKDEP